MCCEVALALSNERRLLGHEQALISNGAQTRHRVCVHTPGANPFDLEPLRKFCQAAGRRLARQLHRAGDLRLFPAWTPRDGTLLNWLRVESADRAVSLLCLITQKEDKSYSLLFEVVGGKR